MLISPARQLAYQILRRIGAGRGFAVDLLQGPAVSELKDADRRLATELVLGVLRWRGELDFQIEQLSGQKLTRFDAEVTALLRMGTYQIRFLEKVPKAAAVNDAVELTKAARKRSAAGLVNAVLRKCNRPRVQLGSVRFEDLEREGIETVQRAIPRWLYDRWAAREWPGPQGPKPLTSSETALRLAWASTQVPRTTLRVTAANAGREAAVAALAQEGIVVTPGAFSRSTLVVKSGSISSSQALREGRIIIQDEASQLVAELARPEPGQHVLDLCAAPGMKAGLLAQLLGQGTLTVCDVSAARLRTLGKLLPPQVPPGVKLQKLQLDATRQLPFSNLFDRILLDAPCSGTGTLARNPEIKWRLEPRDLARHAETQAKMLRHALPLLAPGGRLVYATCSLEPEENEQVVEAVLSAMPEFLSLGSAELAREFSAWVSLFDADGYFRTRPDLHRMDGFFAAVIVRRAASSGLAREP
jgi:16S rRNA (cytosine967-C5)-methyltransferase